MKTSNNEKKNASKIKKKNSIDILDEKEKKKAKRRRNATIALTCVIAIPLFVFGTTFFGYKIWAKNIQFDTTLLPTASAIPSFYDANGNKLEYSADSYISPNDIPENLKKAFVSLEDKRFYEHKGYDIVRMIGAGFSNIKSGKVKEGASTITQQLVKNTHLSNERTIDRKIHEIAIAEKLEKSYSKEEILAMYMSVIYFGGGAYGVNSASMLYFGKSPQELTLAECATLAGIVKNPSKYSPKNSISNATERRNLVLDVMLKNKAITEDECKDAKGEKLTLKTVTSNKDINKFYLDRVIEEVTSELNITKFQLNNSGFKIYTNLDENLQKTLAEQAKNKENFGETPVDSEAVILDNETGAVIANYSSLPYKILRQPGSALKPIAIFAPALEEKLITLATPIVDEKVSFGDFSPSNFGDIYYGNTTPRDAIKHSMNSVAVKIMDYLSPEKAVLYARNFGIPLVDTDKNYALSLGATSKGVSPVKLASAYLVFARGGQKISPHYVKYVVKGDEKLLNCNLNQTKVISAENAYLITSALIDTVKCGTAKSMSVLPFQIAAKTGTVETKNSKNTDAWNVGYTSKHTVLVWHGANGMSEKGGGRPTHHAINIWKQVYATSNQTSKNIGSKNDSSNCPSNYDSPNYPTNFKNKNNTLKCSNYPSKSDSLNYPTSYISTNYPVNFVQPNGIKELKIDTYSSNVNNILTLAGKYTPEKYCKTEIFSYDNAPTCVENCFDNILPPVFEVEAEQNKVKLMLETKNIYDYTICRKDALGNAKIFEFYGATAEIDDKIEIFDTPMSIGGSVEYTVTATLSQKPTNAENLPKAETKKSIYLSYNF